MSHAESAALIEAAALVPGRLRALAGADSAEGAAFRSHVAGCDDCRHELDAWQAVDEALVAVTPGSVGAPPVAKARILSNVLATGVARGPGHGLGTEAARPTSPAQPVSPAQPAPPEVGRVWRTPAGQPLPSPAPAVTPLPVGVASEPPAPEGAPESPASPSGRRGLRLLPGRRDGDNVGFRVFLAVAAAAVFLFVLGAALGGPLGLTNPSATVVPDQTARVELEKSLGRLSDLLQQPGAIVAPLTDQNGDPNGAVVIAPAATNLLGVVTRALPPLADGGRYVCVLVRGDQQYEVGYMKFAGDPAAQGDVAYWVGPLPADVPADAGAPGSGDTFSVFVDGQASGTPLLTTTF